MRLPAELWAPHFIHHQHARRYWPHLLREGGFLEQFVTPLIKARKGNKEVQQFFGTHEFERWWRQLVADKPDEVSKWRIKFVVGSCCSICLPVELHLLPSSHVMLSGGCVVAGTTRGWALAPQQRAASTSPTLHGTTAPSRGRRQTMTTASRWPSPRLRCVAGIPGLLDSTPRV